MCFSIDQCVAQYSSMWYLACNADTVRSVLHVMVTIIIMTSLPMMVHANNYVNISNIMNYLNVTH